jgi:FkbM family methyltransferase
MDLCFNRDARFTSWVVAGDLLRKPFVVIDVGVQGGESPRWSVLGDQLVLHGFDAIEEVIEELRSRNAHRPNRWFHWIAAGNEDGEREFFFNRADPYSSSMYPQGAERYGPLRLEEARRIRVSRLDTLLAERTIPPADFLKIDVEGFEQDVLSGARRLLGSGVLAVETESNFGVSPQYPKSHLGTLQELLLQHKLLVFDLSFNRVPRARFQQALERKGLAPVRDNASVGKIATLNVLFCRDLINEEDAPENYAAARQSVSADQIIKMMIILELYGLNDIAVDTAERFRTQLGGLIDVDHAIALLANPLCRASRLDAMKEMLRMADRMTGLQLTASMRAIRRAVAPAKPSK